MSLNQERVLSGYILVHDSKDISFIKYPELNNKLDKIRLMFYDGNNNEYGFLVKN
jgi:hypothetical protein